MRRTWDPMLLGHDPPASCAGVGVGAASIAGVTPLIYPLKGGAPVSSLSVAYLLAVLVVLGGASDLRSPAARNDRAATRLMVP